MVTTTIRVDEDVKKMLDSIKIHPRETYNDILKRLIEKVKK